MRTGCVLAWVLLTAALGGCSIYPLPQDTTGYDTEHIVRNVRCQARRAVRIAFEDELRRLGDKWVTKRLTGQRLLDLINAPETAENRIEYKDLELKDFVGDARVAFQYYATTQIGYDFTLDMKEQNTQGANVDLLRQFMRRADTIGIGLTADRMRQNTRNFTLQDSFLTLATKVSGSYCEAKPGDNIVYPLTGRMPIEELVSTYIAVNEFALLGDRKGGNYEGTKAGPAVREMADTIMFTTKLTAKNNPMIEYNPGVPGFGVSALSFTNENNRQDMHKVIVLVKTTEVGKLVVSASGRPKEVTVLPPAEARRESTATGLAVQRQRNFEDAVINLSNNGIRANLF